jgi:L,D-peptidoglycan transpeptidase YkuD (ErfK/YbiS/YcfS/YnhG family)
VTRRRSAGPTGHPACQLAPRSAAVGLATDDVNDGGAAGPALGEGEATDGVTGGGDHVTGSAGRSPQPASASTTANVRNRYGFVRTIVHTIRIGSRVSALRRSMLALLAAFALTACGTVTAETDIAAQPADAEASGHAEMAPRAEPSPTPTPTATAPATGKPRPTATAKPATTRPAAPANAAQKLRTLPSTTTQVIIVQAGGFGTSTGTLQAFSKRDGKWTAAFGVMSAKLGTKGFKDSKVEGDLTTPTGVYSIGGTMYGIAANPGVKYGYHKLVEDDWWNENPATAGYNSFFHGADPGGASEALWETNPQYRYFAVINYNIPVKKADPPRGSGIFLHVMVPGRSTAGCVALAESDLVKVLRWLDPAAKPRVVLAPTSELDRY